MSLDPGLLQRARTAAASLADAERTALLARADYHTAIRRLHLGGAPLREIAEALSLSHQRVQQVVSAAGGSWWQVWRRRPARPDAICTWCERPPSEVAQLIAGPKVYICNGCVAAAERALTKPGSGTRSRCSFCRKRGSESNPVVSGRAHVCGECLAVCREILNTRAG
jgi:hypothetical protein